MLLRNVFKKQQHYFIWNRRCPAILGLSFVIENISRDFNHEEKGEEIDDLEPKMEEKEKVTKPRGWNKESVGKDDQQKPKKENPKKKKSQNLEKNEKSGKNPKLPTADGSRQSRLDKENAEKEVANKNVWAERMSKQKKEDIDNDVSRKILQYVTSSVELGNL